VLNIADCQRTEFVVALKEGEAAGTRSETWPPEVQAFMEKSVNRWVEDNKQKHTIRAMTVVRSEMRQHPVMCRDPASRSERMMPCTHTSLMAEVRQGASIRLAKSHRRKVESQANISASVKRPISSQPSNSQKL
jgi:hypothetical protein